MNFWNKLIDEFPNKSQTKSDKIIEFINNLTLVFKWRFASYLELLSNKIISWDPSLLKISANYSDEVPQSLRLFTANNSDEIIVALISYIHLCFKISPEFDHEVIEKIFTCCWDAVKDLENWSTMILNNWMINIITFFSNLYKSKWFEHIRYEVIYLGIELSFIARRKCANNDVITTTTTLLQILFENLEIKPIILRLQKETIETYIKDQNWRIRENAMYIFQLSNAFFVPPLDDSSYFLDKALEFCNDENIYAVRRGRICLKQVLLKNKNLIQSLTTFYKAKILDEIKEYKATNKTSKQLIIKLCQIQNWQFNIAELLKWANILISIWTSSQYSISNWLTNLYLFIYKLIQYVPSLKKDILDCFTDFKVKHLQLVRAQESRYDFETLENLSN